MSLQTTPSAQRLHIGFFGCRNAGKSSLVNAVTGQDLAVVSEVKGTTTDPVLKAMELLPQISDILKQWENCIAAELTEDELELLSSLLARLKDKAAQYMEGR